MNSAILIGAAIGFLFGGWTGLFLGGFVSYWISQMLRASVLRVGVGKVQQQFLDSTFAVMGAICKADGKVTEEEIRVAEALFARLHMNADARDSARRAFNRGKQAGFDLDAEVKRFASASRGQHMLAQMFLHVQLSAIAADGKIHPAEREMVLRIARGLGLSAAEIRQLEAMLDGGAGSASSPDRLSKAYEVLGVEKGSTDAEVKRAYRRLMSEHHPDKLAANGMPDSMREMAEERTREITVAYDLVRKARGFV